MKKVIALILALGLILAAVPAFALNETGGRTDFTFAYEGPPNPTYTISVPANITLAEEGNDIVITASDMEDMEGLKVSVTVGGNNIQRGFVLEGRNSSGTYDNISYDVITDSNVLLEGAGDALNKELVSFTENGTSSYNVKPNVTPKTLPDITFTGSMVYKIGVVAR